MKKLLMGTLGMAMAVSAMGAVTGASTDPAAEKITGTLTLAQMPSSETYSIKVTEGGSLAFGNIGEIVLNGNNLAANNKIFNSKVGNKKFIVVNQNDEKVTEGIKVATTGPNQKTVADVNDSRWFDLTNGTKPATNVFFKDGGNGVAVSSMGFVTTVESGEVTLTSKLYDSNYKFGAYTINGQVWIKKVM